MLGMKLTKLNFSNYIGDFDKKHDEEKIKSKVRRFEFKYFEINILFQHNNGFKTYFTVLFFTV